MRTAKQNSKPTSKPRSAKQAPKSNLLTHAERSAIARLAAFKAHCHKTFQNERTTSEQKEQRKLYAQAQKTFARAFPKLAA